VHTARGGIGAAVNDTPKNRPFPQRL